MANLLYPLETVAILLKHSKLSQAFDIGQSRRFCMVRCKYIRKKRHCQLCSEGLGVPLGLPVSENMDYTWLHLRCTKGLHCEGRWGISAKYLNKSSAWEDCFSSVDVTKG